MSTMSVPNQKRFSLVVVSSVLFGIGLTLASGAYLDKSAIKGFFGLLLLIGSLIVIVLTGLGYILPVEGFTVSPNDSMYVVFQKTKPVDDNCIPQYIHSYGYQKYPVSAWHDLEK